MKKTLQYMISAIGLLSVLLFCVSATASISDASDIIRKTFSEPFNLLLLGIGLIGFGTFMKSKFSR